LLATAEEKGPGLLDELQSARVDLLRGQVVFASGLGSEAPPLLLKAAKRLEPLNVGLARETYLSAWMAALFAGRLAGAGDMAEVCHAARARPAPQDPPHPVDLVLDGLALVITDGPTAAAPTLRRAVSVFAADLTMEEELRWGFFAQAAASARWDYDAWHAMLERQVGLARDMGALEQLPVLLGALGTAVVWSGDFAAATALNAEADAVCEVTGSRAAPFTAMMLASFRGNQAEAAPLIEGTITAATAGGQGIAVAYAQWMAAIGYNSLSRYREALAAARQASEDTSTIYISMWAMPELIEAAARSGDADPAAEVLERLAEFTRAGGTDWGLGIEARSRALLSAGETAENLYREAIDRLGRTRLRPELARAHLLYGEWLRRENRRADAREQLRTAHDMLAAWAPRRSPDAPGASCWPSARPCASGPPSRPARSPRRRRTSPGSPPAAAPTRRSPLSCSCPPAPSNGTCARYSPSSASARAVSCARYCRPSPWPSGVIPPSVR